jgi:hypothetical protein
MSPDLSFLRTLPLTVSESTDSNCIRFCFIDGIKYHFCHMCGGWIKGDVVEYLVDERGILCGKTGTGYYCRRLGHELAFIGKCY